MQSVIYAIIILVIILILYLSVRPYEDYFYGFWVAEDDEFCEQSEIDSMLIFIGDVSRGWLYNTRTCYIIIMNDLCNQGFTLTYRGGWAGIGPGRYRVHASVEFDEENIWADNVIIDIDMRDGSMKIHDGETIYAKLNKQHEITNIARANEKLELVE